jgi:hypothetical protein
MASLIPITATVTEAIGSPVKANPGSDAVTEPATCTTAEDRNVHSSVAVDVTPKIVPTQEAYPEFQLAYKYLNTGVFDNKLPDCLITFQRHNGTYGYFVGDRFGRTDGQRADEIAINPQHMDRRPEHILSTLAHEMVHLWQHHLEKAGLGKAGRVGYHNKQWADKMEEIGLIPSDTGKAGGKRTGDRMSHYIEPGGRFALVVEQLLATGFDFTWREIPLPSATSASGSGGGGGTGVGSGSGNKEGGSASRSGKRTKYSCPHGDLNAWAKPGAALVCGTHGAPMKATD